jgi:hypothetical protein
MEAETRNQRLTSVILAQWEAELGKILFQSQPQADSSQYLPSSKITSGKWTGGAVHVAEHLLCKCLPAWEAQISDFKPQTHKKLIK